MKTLRPLFIGFFIAIVSTGCESNWALDQWSQLLRWIGFSSQSPRNSGSPSPQKSDLQDEEFKSNAAKNAQQNAELLHEMFQVVYIKEPKDRSNFGNWADTLNQGASLEGVYNGLVHSTDYKALEKGADSASVLALKIFSQELAILEIELPKPTSFDDSSLNPESNSPAEAPELAERYSRQFVGNSVFTLKRILGEEAIKVVDLKNEFREKLALWYSKWAVRLTERKVDFGIALRNKNDEAFHYKWALSANEDRIKWEILNRLHRLLNEANQLKQ